MIRSPLPTVAACALWFLACHDASAPAAPPTGAIRVSLSLTGTDFPATYSIGVAGRSVSGQPSVATVIGGLPPFRYALTIVLPRNCQLDGASPPTAEVVAGDTTTVTVSARCNPATGSLLVTTATSGADVDPDGYLLRVEGVAVDGSRYQDNRRLMANGAQTISRVPIGDVRVTLAGLAINCEPAETTSRTVTVAAAEAANLAFTISCAPNDGQLAFVVGSPPAVRHIYVANLNGAGVRRLGDAELSSDEDPA